MCQPERHNKNVLGDQPEAALNLRVPFRSPHAYGPLRLGVNDLALSNSLIGLFGQHIMGFFARSDQPDSPKQFRQSSFEKTPTTALPCLIHSCEV